MVRRWLVRPDQVMYTEAYGEVRFVSRQAMQEAYLDAEAMMARAGGHVSVSSTRHPTDFPGEMLTTAAAFRWQDRTDAKDQPERPAPVVAAPPPEPLPDVETEPEGETGGELEPAAVTDRVGDGLDESALEDEDLSAIPESVR